MNRNLKLLFWLGMFAVSLESAAAREFNGVYEGHNMDHVAFPVGGIGTGMICFEGTGAISHVSLHHVPDLSMSPARLQLFVLRGLRTDPRCLRPMSPNIRNTAG